MKMLTVPCLLAVCTVKSHGENQQTHIGKLNRLKIMFWIFILQYKYLAKSRKVTEGPLPGTIRCLRQATNYLSQVSVNLYSQQRESELKISLKQTK